MTKVVDGQLLELALKFIKPMLGEAISYLAIETISADQSKVRWSIASGVKYPMNFMLVLLKIPDMLAKDLDEGLLNLKKFSKNKFKKKASHPKRPSYSSCIS